MTPEEILALYDQEERLNISLSGMRRESTPEVVRMVNLERPDSVVIYSKLDESNADQVIEEQIEYFQNLGHSFEWKAFDHDQPADLKQRLATHNFIIPEEEEALMVLDLNHPPAVLLQPITVEIRPLRDPEHLEDLAAVMDRVWGGNFLAGHGVELAARLRREPEKLYVYVAYVDGKPACGAWIYFPGTSFGGLYGGSTLPEYRNRGIYTAMLSVRAQLAIEKGVRFLMIDSSRMSRPIVQKHGFQLLTYSYPYEWENPG